MTVNNDGFPFKVGNFECVAVSDGTVAYPEPVFFANAPKERLEQVLREHNIKPGDITVPLISLVINTGQQRVLVDTGGGAGWVPSIGKLLGNLKAAGIKPMDIDMVILTHGHPDHLGGNTDEKGKLVFPKACYVMWQSEWEFWAQKPDLSRLNVDEAVKQLMVNLANKNLLPIKSQLMAIDRETEIIPGIRVISAPGHTPGHVVLSISSGDEQLIFLSDLVLHPLHLVRPDWYPVFDLVPEQALTTRRKFLTRVAGKKSLAMAAHFPFPGLGHVVQKGSEWQWQPIKRKR